ncbi:hypothetical protein AGABI1DRAFT_79586 [Agaricus bisporus var. burnettii JB137-S8]|uniref:G domain-containing protein n=1 Tax=Agaricus bisporus var. burnettii (strain JB137-S8 / ATCC MYA-4627 / FGSC 10392) TaxID=597362 RepID=K5WXV8_AGABU|nr:uncharacterized protein AGABI1DRAFT_79586 [Agaricus bisporus var. burnettii JB137-S8]EKM75638.1 hypothetical protein AGABI1DRAFT_79586 [Agaricus bisporus var. burnettii JB137-S8]
MGPTGAGKSNFIHTLAENETAVGHGLASYTSGVSAYRLKCSDDIDIVLVDTPGFNDTHLSDRRILEVTAKWVKEVGKRDLQVLAFLYLHRISDNRMGSASRKSLKIFQKTAGKDFFSRVTLMTTMWPDPADTVEMEESEVREAELRKEYWAMMIEEDSKVERFTNTRESARKIVDSIIIAESKRQWSKLQQELVDQGKDLPATEAGKELHAAYEDMVARQNFLMQQLRAEMEKAAADPVTITALQQQLRDELVKFKNARKEMRKLESSREKEKHHILITLFFNFLWFLARPGNSPR